MLCWSMTKRCPDTFGELPQYLGYYLIEILTQKEAILRIKTANAILKRPVNKLFRIEHTNHDTNQKDRTRKLKLR